MCITEQEYDALPGIRFSRLRRMSLSALEYHANIRRTSEALSVGAATHSAVLTPDEFAQSYATMPKFDRRTKQGKADAEAWQEEHAGAVAIDAETMAQVEAIRDAVLSSPHAKALLDDAEHVERATLWTDPETGLECKCRADLVTRGCVLCDLKTSRDVSPRAFARSAAQFHYHAQLGFYAMGIGNVRECRIIAVQSSAPYDCVVYRLDPATIACGEALAREWLRRVKQCETEQRWPGVANDGVLDLELPEWAMGEAELVGMEAA